MPDNINVSPVGLVQTTVSRSIAFVNDPELTQKVLKVALGIFKVTAVILGVESVFARFSGVIDNAIELTDTAATIPDTAALLNTAIKADNIGKIGFLSCFVAADWAGVALLLEDYKLFELASHVICIGGKQVFLDVLQGTVGLGFAIKAVEVVWHDWPEADTGWKQLSCAATVTRSVVEVAIRALAIGGISAGSVGLIATLPLTLGIVSAGLGLADFFLLGEEPPKPAKVTPVKPGVDEPEVTIGGFILDKLDFTRKLITKTETLDKICRTAMPIIDGVILTVGPGAISTHLRGRIKDFRDVYFVSQVLNRVQEWIGEAPREDNKHKKPYWEQGHRWWNYLGQSMFTTASFLETVSVLGKWNLIDLAALSDRLVKKYNLENLKNVPVLSIVFGSLYTVSALITGLDRFVAYMKDRTDANTYNAKRSKWTESFILYQEARAGDTAEKRRQAKRVMMDKYENKICLNQLKLQSAILTYTLGTKHGLELNYSEAVPSNDSAVELIICGQMLKEAIEKASDKIANNQRVKSETKITLLEDVDHFVARMAALKEKTPELRRVSVELNNALAVLNHKFGESSGRKKLQDFDVCTPLERIKSLYTKINKEQRLHYAISNGSSEATDYFEWKYYKWTDKSLRLNLKRNKAFNLAFDLLCKAVGGAVGMYCTFNPIGAAFGEVLLRGLTDDEKKANKRREWIKTGISALGSFYGFYTLFDIEKQEELIKQLDAGNRFKVDGVMEKPTMASLVPLETSEEEAQEAALDTEVVLEENVLTAQIKSILALTDQIMCKKFDGRLILKRGMIKQVEASAAA